MFNDASAIGMIEIVNDNGEANHKVPCSTGASEHAIQNGKQMLDVNNFRMGNG